MTCHVCKAQIASGSRFCSVCGSSTEPVAVSVAGGNARSESLLSEANLYRLRSQWTEAEKRCVDVMRIDSHNVHAHVLLGDIYRDQGKLDEARQWYQMALDLEPDNRAINDKLRETRSRPLRQPAPPPPASKPAVSGSLGTQNLMGLSPTNWFRAIWLLCGLFAVAVISIILWIRAHPRTLPVIPAGTVPVPDAVRYLPDGQLRTPDNSVSGTLAQKLPQPTPNPNAGTASSPNSRAPAQNPSVVSASSRIQEITSQLSRPGTLPADVTLGGVSVDARGQAAEVLLLQRVPAGVVEADLRAAIARAGLLAAQTVFATGANYTSVTVDARIVTSGGQPQPYFEGDIDRATAQRVDPSLRDEDRFTKVWWATGQRQENRQGP